MTTVPLPLRACSIFRWIHRLSFRCRVSADSATTARRPPGFKTRTTVTIENEGERREYRASLHRIKPQKIPEFRPILEFATDRQARWVSGNDVRKQNQFIDQLFDLPA